MAVYMLIRAAEDIEPFLQQQFDLINGPHK